MRAIILMGGGRGVVGAVHSVPNSRSVGPRGWAATCGLVGKSAGVCWTEGPRTAGGHARPYFTTRTPRQTPHLPHTQSHTHTHTHTHTLTPHVAHTGYYCLCATFSLCSLTQATTRPGAPSCWCSAAPTLPTGASGRRTCAPGAPTTCTPSPASHTPWCTPASTRCGQGAACRWGAGECGKGERGAGLWWGRVGGKGGAEEVEDEAEEGLAWGGAEGRVEERITIASTDAKVTG